MKYVKFIPSAMLLTSLALFPQVSSAKDVTINLGYATAESSSYGVLATKFEELAEKYSNGTIDVKIRCCGQLITEDEAFKAMQLGTVDMYIITANNVSPHFPLMDAFVLPYIFESKDHAYRVLEGDVGQQMADRLKEDTGVYLLTYGVVGDRDFFNSRNLITTIDDMKGMKVRVPKNQVMLDTFDAFGAAAIPLPWADTPTALQTRAVDGGDAGTPFVKSQKFYEFMPYFSVLEHFTYFSPLFASPRIMNKLDDEQREAVMRAAAEAGAYQKEVVSEQVADIRKFLTTEGGMQTAEVDKSGFIEAGKKVQDEFAAGKGEDFQNLLESVRAAAN